MTQIELAILKQIEEQGYLDARKISIKYPQKIIDIRKGLIRKGYLKSTPDYRSATWLTDKGKQALDESLYRIPSPRN